jgi:ABC-type transport system substrate-binding protein
MSSARRGGSFAIVGLLAFVLAMPTAAEARGGRYAAGVFGGFAAGALIGAAIGGGFWGPHPYYYGYPAPYYYYPAGPYYYRQYGYYDCYPHVVWTGRRWRRVCY